MNKISSPTRVQDAAINFNEGKCWVINGQLSGMPLFYKADNTKLTVSNTLRDFNGFFDWDRYLLQSENGFATVFEPYLTDVDVLKPGNGFYGSAEGVVKWQIDDPWSSKRGAMLTAERLLKHLERVALAMSAEKRIVFLFSGGLDAAMLACICHRLGLPFTGVLIYEDDDSEEKYFAELLADELNVELSCLQMTDELFLQLIPELIYLFEDPSPDILTAAGLVAVIRYGVEKGDLIVSGEPADAVLGGLREYVGCTEDRARSRLRQCALTEGANRGLFLVRRAAQEVGATATFPYADEQLIVDALSTPWTSLLDIKQVFTEGKLGGPGYKILQREVARKLGYRALNRIADRRKDGFPLSCKKARMRLQQKCEGRRSTSRALKWDELLCSYLFFKIQCQKESLSNIRLEEILDDVSNSPDEVENLLRFHHR